MNDDKQKSSLPFILGCAALIAVLFIGINLIFAGLGAAIPKGGSSGQTSTSQRVQAETSAPQSQVEDTDAPAFCPFCGKALNDSFQWGQFCPYCGEKVVQ